MCNWQLWCFISIVFDCSEILGKIRDIQYNSDKIMKRIILIKDSKFKLIKTRFVIILQCSKIERLFRYVILRQSAIRSRGNILEKCLALSKIRVALPAAVHRMQLRSHYIEQN